MIRMQDVDKFYKLGSEKIQAVKGLSQSIKDGEYVAITGPSGSGKSTLMNIIGCLDVPDGGTYELAGVLTNKYTGAQLAKLRNTHIGFIFQGFNLLSRLSALENVELPLIYQHIGRRKRHTMAKEALERIGLGDRLRHKPQELSGGQQQRVAIARALVTNPKLILADEPTGNLDSKTGLEIMDLFSQLHAQGNTIVLITHDPNIAKSAERSVHIVDGQIQDPESTQVH
ncbi:MAG: ABC transporter ATP-binding protein [Clostridiales bacterium]|nr:ABC transporter ATP-binding protein [Clostridiales bacterium]